MNPPTSSKRSKGLLLLLAILAPLAIIIGTAFYRITAMPGQSYRGLFAPPTAEERDLAERLRRHVHAIASVEHNVAQYQELERSAQYIERTLADLGYAVKRIAFDSAAGKVRNLEVTLKSRQTKDPKRPVIVVGAHYDSAEDTAGANDNGSGAAAVLELARLLKNLDGAIEAELILVLYVNEEPPYFKTEQMGSRVHAAELKARGRNVVAMVSLETMGFFSEQPGSQHYPFPFSLIYPDKGDFIGFVGDYGSRPLVRHLVGLFRKHAAFPSEGVAAPGFIPGIDWSDHWSYRQEGVAALMVTDTAPFRYAHYHTPQDTIDKIDFARLARVVKGMEALMREFSAQPMVR